MARVAAYHTKSKEYPDVYHDHDNCPDGQRILSGNWDAGTDGRSRCGACSKMGYGAYEDWFDSATDKANARVASATVNLNELKGKQDVLKERIKSAKLAKKLIKLKSRTPEEQAQLDKLREELKLSPEDGLGKLDKLIEKTASESIPVGNDLVKAKNKVASASERLPPILKLRDEFEQTYAGVMKGFDRKDIAEDIERLADIVMNEVRNVPLAMSAVAYAYRRLHGGKVEEPANKEEISDWTRSEVRFGTLDDGQQAPYIKQVIKSLKVAAKCMSDPNNTNDPTGGADHWASPNAMSKKRRYEYDTQTGSYSWLIGYDKAYLDGVAPGSLTLLIPKAGTPKKAPGKKKSAGAGKAGATKRTGAKAKGAAR